MEKSMYRKRKESRFKENTCGKKQEEQKEYLEREMI